MKIRKLTGSQIPLKLRDIPGPPPVLYVIGDMFEKLCQSPVLAVVGSRRVSPYGRITTQQLTADAARHGAVIVSGLALGVDAVAHEAALSVQGKTIAVLPCGLDAIYPASHRLLAKQILQKGGALVSEYPVGTPPLPHHFVARNRLVSGLADALLITEATEKSGTLHTANFALDQGREVLCVPGNITSLTSVGTNRLIKTGAVPVLSSDEVLESLKIMPENKLIQEIVASTPAEHTILKLIKSGVTSTNELLDHSRLPAQEFNQTLTMLEINGHIKATAGHWHLC